MLERSREDTERLRQQRLGERTRKQEPYESPNRDIKQQESLFPVLLFYFIVVWLILVFFFPSLIKKLTGL